MSLLDEDEELLDDEVLFAFMIGLGIWGVDKAEDEDT